MAWQPARAQGLAQAALAVTEAPAAAEPALVVPAQGHPSLSLCSLPKDSPGPGWGQCWGHQLTPCVCSVPRKGVCPAVSPAAALCADPAQQHLLFLGAHAWCDLLCSPQPLVCPEAAGTQNPVPSGGRSSACPHGEYFHQHTKQSLGNRVGR